MSKQHQPESYEAPTVEEIELDGEPVAIVDAAVSS